MADLTAAHTYLKPHQMETSSPEDVGIRNECTMAFGIHERFAIPLLSVFCFEIPLPRVFGALQEIRKGHGDRASMREELETGHSLGRWSRFAG